jgi:hypothetical protein
MTGFLLAIVVVIVGFGIYGSWKRGRARRTNAAINNAIIDLFENGTLGYATVQGEEGLKRSKTEAKTPTLLHIELLKKGLAGKDKVTAKTFHSNLYRSKASLNDLVDEVADSLDFSSTPNSRIASQSNSEVAMIVPLVIFGSPEGTHHDGNDSYAGDSSYVGAGDIGGGHSHGGHDGGGHSDGGGFGGGDSGGGDGGGD